MKTLMIILALLFSGAFTFAQNIVTAIQMEYTVAGPQYGSSFMYESKKQWGLGIEPGFWTLQSLGQVRKASYLDFPFAFHTFWFF